MCCSNAYTVCRGSNQRPLDLKSNNLPLCYCAPVLVTFARVTLDPCIHEIVSNYSLNIGYMQHAVERATKP